MGERSVLRTDQRDAEEQEDRYTISSGRVLLFSSCCPGFASGIVDAYGVSRLVCCQRDRPRVLLNFNGITQLIKRYFQ